MKTDPETFAQRLKRLMVEKALSQTELASKTEIDRSEVNRIVHGKRPPKPREAAWLIEAVGSTFDEFADGLEVIGDPAFKDEVGQHQGVARRVLDAERERDEARASRDSLEASFRADENSWRAERQHLQHTLRDARRECAERVKQREDSFAERENELLQQLSLVTDRNAVLERERRDAQQLATDRLQQISRLTTALDYERSRVAVAGLFGGLVGALLGAGANALLSSEGDGQEDDEDGEQPRRRRRRS